MMTVEVEVPIEKLRIDNEVVHRQSTGYLLRYAYTSPGPSYLPYL